MKKQTIRVLERHVLIEMNIPSEDLPDYYSSLNFYLCASHMEGVPYPVIESMACSAIPITTPVGIAREIISNGVNGFLLNSDFTPSQFAELVKDLYEKPAAVERIKNNARAYATKNLDWRKLDYSKSIKAYQLAIYSFRQRSFRVRLKYVVIAGWMFSTHLSRRFKITSLLQRLKRKTWK